MTEVDLDAQELFDFLVSCKQQIIVGGHGLYFGEPLLDTKKSSVNVRNCHVQNLFDE